jgi:hypothetical protein
VLRVIRLLAVRTLALAHGMVSVEGCIIGFTIFLNHFLIFLSANF